VFYLAFVSLDEVRRRDIDIHDRNINMREGVGPASAAVHRPTSGALKTSLQPRPRCAARA